MKRYKVSFCGDLGLYPFRELILSFHAQEENGALYIRSERITKKIYFQDGFPIYAQSNSAHDSLLRKMLDKGLLDLETLLKFQERNVDNDKPFEMVLFQEGLLNGEQYQELEKERIHDILVDLMRWDDGSYYYRFDFERP